MEIYADFTQKVHIDPIDVIEKLIQEVTYVGGWIREKDGKYYRVTEHSAGCHSYEEEDEIEKDDYEYYLALKLVLDRQIQNKKYFDSIHND